MVRLSPPRSRSPWHPHAAGPAGPQIPGGSWRDPGQHRRRILPLVKWAAVLAAVGLIFRRAIESVVLIALSAVLHLVGINVHLPSIKFAWPWQTITAGTTSNIDLGPWVLQKIEGISKPALGRANFNFFFTHKVSKDIGPWPCWYASTFYAVGHAAATVNLNPGPAWWTTQHSWTYPGFGCGALIRPQFSESVLYSTAQHIAFYKAHYARQVTGALISTAETEAVQTVRDNFIQPTVNALGYTLDRFTIRWATAP